MITREKINSRKLLVTLFVFATSCGLLAIDKLTSGDFAMVTISIVGAYMASRAWVDGKANSKGPEAN